MGSGERIVRRQTAVAGGSSRGFRLDPHSLPVRYAGPYGTREPAFVLDRYKAIVAKPLRGNTPLTLAVPIDAFSGVAVREMPQAESDGRRLRVELLHPDPSLSLPLAVADEPEEIAADWQAWGEALNLPLLVIEEDGTVSAPARRIGALVVAEPAERRKRWSLFRRRPRFLTRRKPGAAMPDVSDLAEEDAFSEAQAAAVSPPPEANPATAAQP